LWFARILADFEINDIAALPPLFCYFDLDTRVLEPAENPFGPKVLPMYPVRSVTDVSGPDFDERGMLLAKSGAVVPIKASPTGLARALRIADEGIWLVSFMEYDLGYIDLEEKTLQPLDNPFGPKV
jgi:hypothetical protein